MSSISARRLSKELSEIKSEGCPVGKCEIAAPKANSAIGLALPNSNYRFILGITLVKADDFATWWFTIEVMGESLYQVR